MTTHIEKSEARRAVSNSVRANLHVVDVDSDDTAAIDAALAEIRAFARQRRDRALKLIVVRALQ